MKVARAWLAPFVLPLRAPLETAHGRLAERFGVLLTLEDASGTRGYGEAVPIAGFPCETLGAAEAALESAAQQLLSGAIIDDAHFARAPLALTALRCALADLAARQVGQSLAQSILGGPPAATRLELNVLVAGSDPREIATAASAARDDGFETFKLKVGAGALEADVERVAALRGALGSAARVRLDANEAWDEAQAERALAAFTAHDIEFVEQPVPANRPDAFARLRKRAPMPLALDEAATSREAVEQILSEALADVIVLKPALLGGPQAFLSVARRAERAGIALVVTSFIDSAIGVAHAAECAAMLSTQGLAHGLATQRLLADDVAASPLAGGRWVRGDAAGIGISPDGEALARLSSGVTREIRA